MKLTVIGYYGGFPAKNAASPCYLLEEDGGKYLLDCGSGALLVLQKYTALAELDAVFISHMHADHMADIYTLEQACLVDMQLGRRQRPLDIYLFAEDFSALAFDYPSAAVIHPIVAGKVVHTPQLSFSFLETKHTIPCVAIAVQNKLGKRLVYSGDTGYFAELGAFINGADALIIESSLFTESGKTFFGHLSTHETRKIIQDSQPQKTILTHFPHFGKLSTLFNEVCQHDIEDVYLAKEGLEFIL